MARGVVALLFPVARRAQHVQPEGRPELCGMCERDFVSPVEWEPVGRRIGGCCCAAASARRGATSRSRTRSRCALTRMIGQAEAMTVPLQLGLVAAADFATGPQPPQHPVRLMRCASRSDNRCVVGRPWLTAAQRSAADDPGASGGSAHPSDRPSTDPAARGHGIPADDRDHLLRMMRARCVRQRAVCVVIRQAEPTRFERAALRWLARFCLERREA
jgi:hypothetical protein